MNKFIEMTRNIEDSFKGMRGLALCALIAGCIVSVSAMLTAFSYAERQREKIYVLDEGKSLLLALQSDAILNKELEIKDHVTRFHELFFNLSPQAKTINENLDKSFNLSDESAFRYSQDLAEKGFYSRIISANITQQVIVDSVVVTPDSYPYQVKTYGRQYVIRESNISEYSLVSTCQLINTSRSDVNPHGLLIEKFAVVENELNDSKKR